MLYINDHNINTHIEFAPNQYFSHYSLITKIINNKDKLENIIKDNINKNDINSFINIPVLLTFIHGKEFNKYYSQIINIVITGCKHEIEQLTQYNKDNIFENLPYSKCIITSILDNQAIDLKFKKQLISKLFQLFIHLKAGGFLWASLLTILYKERKTNSIPIYCINILFKKISFIFEHKYAINNFMMIDTFIKYLTAEEINNTFPILLLKKNILQWLNTIYIPNFIWLVTRLSKFLPYK